MSAVQSSYPAASSALKDAKETACQVLNPGSSTSSSSANVVHHHHHDHWGWGPSWGWYHPMPCYSSGSSRSSGDRDYTWVAIPAAAAGLGTAYFLGENYSEWQRASRGIERLQGKQLDVASELNTQPSLWGKMTSVFQKHQQLLNHQKDAAEMGLATKAAMLTSAAVALTGALAGSGALVAVGFGTAVAAGGVMLFRAGFESADQSLQTEARDLQVAAQAAENAFEAAPPVANKTA